MMLPLESTILFVVLQILQIDAETVWQDIEQLTFRLKLCARDVRGHRHLSVLPKATSVCG